MYFFAAHRFIPVGTGVTVSVYSICYVCISQLEGWEGLGTETGHRLGFIFIFFQFSMSGPDLLDCSNFI